MGLDHSFDIVSRIDLQEVANAVNVTLKEIRNRFDFKNSRVGIALEKEKMTLVAEDDFKIKALRTALEEKLVKRKVPLRALEYGRIADGADRTVKQEVLFQAGIPVEIIPGVSAITTALAMSGIDPVPFQFHGFLPHKSAQRRKVLTRLAPLPCSLVFFESPYRLLKTLGDIHEILGNRRIVICRESRRPVCRCPARRRRCPAARRPAAP